MHTVERRLCIVIACATVGLTIGDLDTSVKNIPVKR